jgi:hypothetical protein
MTANPTVTASMTPAPTVTATATPNPTFTATATASPVPSVTPTVTATITATFTVVPPTPTPTLTATATPTPTETTTPAPTPSAIGTPNGQPCENLAADPDLVDPNAPGVCNGVCPPNEVCEFDAVLGCSCQPAPCGGPVGSGGVCSATCPAGQICVLDGGDCRCAPQNEICGGIDIPITNGNDPTCGGLCFGLGQTCEFFSQVGRCGCTINP